MKTENKQTFYFEKCKLHTYTQIPGKQPHMGKVSRKAPKRRPSEAARKRRARSTPFCELQYPGECKRTNNPFSNDPYACRFDYPSAKCKSRWRDYDPYDPYLRYPYHPHGYPPYRIPAAPPLYDPLVAPTSRTFPYSADNTRRFYEPKSLTGSGDTSVRMPRDVERERSSPYS